VLSLGTGGFHGLARACHSGVPGDPDDDWLKKSELAVTFLDRYRQRSRLPRIKHNDALRLDESVRYLIKATLATEDRRFYDISASTTSRPVVAP